jgi:hypothetical protein
LRSVLGWFEELKERMSSTKEWLTANIFVFVLNIPTDLDPGVLRILDQ